MIPPEFGFLPKAWVSDLRAAIKYVLAGAMGVCWSSCGTLVRPSLNSPDPQARIAAAVQAGESGDQEAVPLLVDLLEDEDGAVRLYAILALEKITGTRRGYDYAAPALRRAVAVRGWREWVAEERGGDEAGKWAAAE
jgi:hypothetical protein